MKKIYTLLILLLLSVTMCYSQATYPTSIKNTFSGGNNGGWTGNYATDDVVSFNSIDGNMDVAVKKTTSAWSIVGFYMGNCWTQKIVFNQTNRFVELRVKSAATFKCTIGPWGNMDDCKPQAKNWTPAAFSYTNTDEWQIIWTKMPATTGGSQNLIDTLGAWLAISLPDGNYSFDYVYIGDAAKPVIPTIDIVKDKNVQECATLQTVNLTGIEIPGRLYDGLTITAESKSDGFLKDIAIMDLGGGTYIDETNKSASLQFSPVVGMSGNADSIIVTLKDTIRGSVKKMAFKVSILKCSGLETITDKIEVVPTQTYDNVKVLFSESVVTTITVIDQLGNTRKTVSVNGTSDIKVDLSDLNVGLYYLKFADGTVKKVIKL